MENMFFRSSECGWLTSFVTDSQLWVGVAGWSGCARSPGVPFDQLGDLLDRRYVVTAPYRPVLGSCSVVCDDAVGPFVDLRNVHPRVTPSPRDLKVRLANACGVAMEVLRELKRAHAREHGFPQRFDGHLFVLDTAAVNATMDLK